MKTIKPNDQGYDAERAGFQTAMSHRPSVIVPATGPEDVQAAVTFARDHDVPVAVQATGHGINAPADGGVLISTRRMNAVRVNPAEKTAWLAAGAQWTEVIVEAARHGLAPLSGSNPHVGAVSYTLGGGLGLLARQYGYAADHVRTIDVVTPDGRLRHVTEGSEPDLFWALRGGRDNFGVVTGLEVELIPVTRIYAGALLFQEAESTIDGYLLWTDNLPEEMTSSLTVLPGHFGTQIQIAYHGDRAAGERLVAPLRAIGPRLKDTLDEIPYAESGSIYNEPTEPHSYRGTNVMLRDLSAAMTSTLVRPDRVVSVRHLGGALSREPAMANAVGHRDARYMLGVLTGGAEVPALPPGGRCLNFLYGEGDTRDAYDPDAYRRLTELKAVYDPANLFRLNHNIPPAG